MARGARLLSAGAAIGAVLACASVAGRRGRTRERPAPRFDPPTVARIETEGWRAYYDRRFLRGFLLLMRLAHGEFAMGLLPALRASYFAARGQMAFAGERGNTDRVREWMTRYYALSPRREGVRAEDLAGAEIEYWIVHRRHVHDEDKTALIDAFANLHALLFGGSAALMRPSAEQRTLACNAVDSITGGRSTARDEDWRLVERHLTAAYTMALDAVRSASRPG